MGEPTRCGDCCTDTQDQGHRMSDPTTATPDLEGPLCYGFTRDGVWLDTYYGWVIPDEAVADAGEAGPTRDSQRSAAPSAASRGSHRHGG
jgi:hypothetical protein